MSEENLGCKLMSTFDAHTWAEEFVKLNPTANKELMHTWFASAIMCGHDFAIRKQQVEIERQRDLIEEQQIFINKIKELSSSLEEGDKSKLWQMLKASNDSKDLVND